MEFDDLLEEYTKLFKGIPISRSTGENGPRYFRANVDAVQTANPRRILEFGFNRGSSALAFLMGTKDAIVTSVDTKELKVVQKAVDYFQELFPDRFQYISLDSSQLLSEDSPYLDKWVDFTYIDGDHSYGGMKADIQTSLKLGAKYILLDEYWNLPHKKDCQRLVKEFRLEVIKDYSEGWGDAIYSVLTVPPAD